MANREAKPRNPGTARRTAWLRRPVELDARLSGKRVEWLGEPRRIAVAVRRQDGLRVLEARVPPVRIAQPEDAPADPAASFNLVVQLAGVGRYRFGRDAVELPPGSAALIDEGRPCAVLHPDGAHVVTWQFRRAQIAPFLPPAPVPPLIALPGAAGDVAAAHAVALARAMPRLPDGAASGLADNLATLVGLALASDAEGNPRSLESHRVLMRRRALALIEARFRDPGFGPEAAALALGISRRWLAALLAGDGAGFAERLAARRIDEAVCLLRDPEAAHLSVTQIAFASGFVELSTFYRQFRRRVGAAPGSLR